MVRSRLHKEDPQNPPLHTRTVGNRGRIRSGQRKIQLAEKSQKSTGTGVRNKERRENQSINNDRNETNREGRDNREKQKANIS